ncbi:uncharacterized protein LOC143212853 [Lasioglossum baleicum]|uniref:uncharacterized protein LOC143212853 n=1 Tax=Lasioglossum baleicum TaxID=434251 RepID=UPI003FCCA575
MMAENRRSLANLTIVELKELLRSRDLVVSRSKAELVARLIGADPNIEDTIQERYDTAENQNQDFGSGTSLAEREMEILRQERDLLQRELDLMRRERELMTPPRSTGSSVTVRPNASIRTIAELLSEFTGAENTFKLWKQQVERISRIYSLDDCAAVTIITLRLRGKTLKWFNSKPSLLELSASLLLEEIRKMFDHCMDKLAVRREFENRTWQRNESFPDYFHDKITLANKIMVDPEELVDLAIDGVPDAQLRDQARMQRLETADDLLETFRKLSLRSDRESKEQKRPVPGRLATTRDIGGRDRTPRDSTQEKVVRCFNCNESGHWKKDCTKPRREWGSCFRCGEKSHRAKDCPLQTLPAQSRRQQQTPISTTVSTTQPGTTTHLVQPLSPQTPFSVPITCTAQDNGGATTCVSTVAIIDSGSPVSLIRRDALPSGFYFKPPVNNTFYGVNYSPVNVVGAFTTEICVNDARVPITFFVVPDTTMSHFALLGRDFIRSPAIEIKLGSSTEIKVKEREPEESDMENFIQQILKIDYVENPISASHQLNVDPEVGSSVEKKLEEIYFCKDVEVDDNKQRPNTVEAVITLKTEHPICFRPRRLAFADKEKVRIILDDLLREGTIRPSNSPYASPIVLVRKKNGEIRLCVDYRELNKHTIRDNFPVPLIDDCLDQLRDKKYFTKLDLKNGFHHVKVTESSVKYTSFITPLGQYEYLKMPFGLTNAPRIFQRFLDEIFSDLLRQNKLLLYLDDFLVATETIDEHLDILREIFRLARKFNLRFRLDKCSFFYRQITYLGYSISENGIAPAKENIESVVDYPAPRNIKEVQCFVGLESYLRRFIKDFSLVARPFFDLLRKNAIFCFRPEQSQAFVTLKQRLTNDPILAIYFPKLDTELHCDANSSGFGAILLEKQTNKVFRPVFSFSKRIKFKGPYEIKKVLALDRYVITDVEGHQVSRAPFTGVVGPDQMKFWIKSGSEKGNDTQ